MLFKGVDILFILLIIALLPISQCFHSRESRFNHKTAAEDVHITTESDNDSGSEKEGTDHESDGDDGTSSEKEGNDHESDGDDEPVTHDSHSEGGDGSGSDLELSSGSGNESPFLEIIMIKDVKAGAEVYISPLV